MQTNTTQKEIKVSGGKPWLARVVGACQQYGTENEFLKPSKQISRTLAVWIVGPGVYKHDPRNATCDNTRRDTGYLHIDGDGAVREITKDEAIALA